MRFVLAITALVLAGIMLILGIGQTTFLAGPRQVVYTAPLDAQNGLAVIPADALTGVQGQTTVVLKGVDPVVAVGHNRDVQAWAAPFEHSQVAADTQTGELSFEVVRENAEAVEAYAAVFAPAAEEGESEEVELPLPNPVGSDLWLEERGAEIPEVAEDEAQPEGEEIEEPATVRLPVNLSTNQSVLVFVADLSQPAELSIEWVQDRRTPWAGPLLLGGGVFALIGALLYLWAVDHDRRGLGPRRGRKGPLLGIRNIFGGMRTGKSKNTSKVEHRGSKLVALPALGLALTLGLSGCSPSYWPDLSPEQSEAPEADQNEASTTAVAPVPVTQGQIDNIIDDIVAISGEADTALDAAGLDVRFTGDALVEREANYTIRRAVSDYDVIVPRITDEALGYQLVQSTETWPRTIFTVVASESSEAPPEAPASEDEAQPQDSPSLALIMSQANPHSNFLVSRTIALRGGITMPEAAPAEEGTARLANDIQSLVMVPLEVGPSYAAVLSGGTGVEQAEFFNLEGDTLVERSGAAWVAQSTQAAEAAGQGIQYSVSAAQSESRTISLSTGAGGAIVATTILETRVEEPDGGRWRPTVPKSLAALSGLEGQQDKLVSVVAHQLLFYVPGAIDGGKIELLGYTSDLIEARNS